MATVNESLTQITLHNDDQPDEWVEAVNKMLAPYGLKFEDDGEEHDGFVILNLVGAVNAPDFASAERRHEATLESIRRGARRTDGRIV